MPSNGPAPEKPVSPGEVEAQKKFEIPSYVIRSFNEMIKANYSVIYKNAKIDQNVLISLIIANSPPEDKLTQQDVFDRGYLNIEDLYEENGWIVEYEKPSIGDDFKAFFRFSKEEK